MLKPLIVVWVFWVGGVRRCESWRRTHEVMDKGWGGGRGLSGGTGGVTGHNAISAETRHPTTSPPRADSGTPFRMLATAPPGTRDKCPDRKL